MFYKGFLQRSWVVYPGEEGTEHPKGKIELKRSQKQENTLFGKKFHIGKQKEINIEGKLRSDCVIKNQAKKFEHYSTGGTWESFYYYYFFTLQNMLLKTIFKICGNLHKITKIYKEIPKLFLYRVLSFANCIELV